MAERGDSTSGETSKREEERARASGSDGVDQRNVVVAQPAPSTGEQTRNDNAAAVVTPPATAPAPSRSSNNVAESEVDRILRVKDNAYSVLRLDRRSNPTTDDIKKSHRALSRLVHPDKNPGDPRAADASAALNAAVDILTDPRKRRVFDLYVESEVERQGGGGSSGGNVGRSFTDWEADTFRAPRWVLRLLSFPGGGIFVGILAVLALLLMIPAFVVLVVLSLLCFPIRLSLFYCCGLGEPIFVSKKQGEGEGGGQGAGATATATATSATSAPERDVELGQQR